MAKSNLALPMEDERFFHELSNLMPRLRRLALGLAGSAGEADRLAGQVIGLAMARFAHVTPGTIIDRWLFGLLIDAWLSSDEADRGGRRVTGDIDVTMKDAFSPVRNFLEARSRTERAALMLVCVEGHSYADIAIRLTLESATVGPLIAELRAGLAAAVTPGGGATNLDPTSLDDVTLAGFADGELDAKQAWEVSILLESDPAARARLAALRHAATAIRATVNGPMGEPVPKSLHDLIDARRAQIATATELAERQFMRRQALTKLGLWAAVGLVVGLAAIGLILLWS